MPIPVGVIGAGLGRRGLRRNSGWAYPPHVSDDWWARDRKGERAGVFTREAVGPGNASQEDLREDLPCLWSRELQGPWSWSDRAR